MACNTTKLWVPLGWEMSKIRVMVDLTKMCVTKQVLHASYAAREIIPC
jgi:hypothetical protein